jgi:hypothetical protein
MARAFETGNEHGIATEDRSLAKALNILKEIKAAGKTWQGGKRIKGNSGQAA